MKPLSFVNFVAIDWSGAVGPRQPGIAVAVCKADTGAPALVRPGHVWSRQEVLDWLVNDLPQDALVGVDLGIALAFADCGAYLPGWDASPADARALWALVDDICRGEANLGANSFVDHPDASRHFRRHGGRQGDRFVPGRGRLRVTEERQRAAGLNPCSNFNLVGAAQVGKSSLTGMRMLHRLQGAIPVWPIDPLPSHGPVIVEIYTALAAVAAGRTKSRAKMRDAGALDAALAALGTTSHAALPHYSDHATDALLTAAWMRKAAGDPQLWSPAGLEAVRHTEGWTFGVP